MWRHKNFEYQYLIKEVGYMLQDWKNYDNHEISTKIKMEIQNYYDVTFLICFDLLFLYYGDLDML